METSDKHSICNRNSSSVDMDVLRSTTDTDKLTLKYDNLTDVDVDKCVNNQKICNNNLKNAKTIHNTDCNVVIDDDIQTKQQQQKQSVSVEQPLESSPQPPSLPSTYGCKHYKRKAKFVVSAHTHTHTYCKTNKIYSLQLYILICFVSLRFDTAHNEKDLHAHVRSQKSIARIISI